LYTSFQLDDIFDASRQLGGAVAFFRNRYKHLDKDDQPIEQFPLLDGLIINKEDGENHWLIEALVPVIVFI
jgi:hypothetical protein